MGLLGLAMVMIFWVPQFPQSSLRLLKILFGSMSFLNFLRVLLGSLGILQVPQHSEDSRVRVPQSSSIFLRVLLGSLGFRWYSLVFGKFLKGFLTLVYLQSYPGAWTEGSSVLFFAIHAQGIFILELQNLPLTIWQPPKLLAQKREQQHF